MKGVLIIGSGKRVRDAALPAFQRLTQRFSVQALFARTAKRIDVGGIAYDVTPLEALGAGALASVDLVYVAVAKDAVPRVLAHLAAHDVSRIDVLIDTPVVRFKHFGHAARLARFRNAWVAEDCAYLPWLDTVRAAFSGGALGALQRATFHRSAYAYHGIATAKALFACDSIARGRRKRGAGGSASRELELAHGRGVTIVEPRDYSVGHVALFGERGVVSDRAQVLPGALAFEPIVMDGACRGFRIGDVETRLDDDEAELTRGDRDGASVTARMEAMKRVGFLRLLRAIDAGRGAYPLESGLDDMVVDYYLDKIGFWLATPLTSPRAGLGRGLLRAASKLGGG
jgi:hypothetical protein